jgi:hypothetical protein
MHLCVATGLTLAANATQLEQTLQIQVEDNSGCFGRHAGAAMEAVVCQLLPMAGSALAPAVVRLGSGGFPYFIPGCNRGQASNRIRANGTAGILRPVRSVAYIGTSATSGAFLHGGRARSAGWSAIAIPRSTLRSCCFLYQIAIEDMAEICQFRLQCLHGRQTAFRRSSAEGLTDKAVVTQKTKWIGFLVEQSYL